MASSKVWGLLGVSVPFDPALKLVSSPAFRPSILAFLRLTFAVYTFITLLFVLIWEGATNHNAKTFFSYFTELSYIGLCAYFWASGVQTTVFALNSRHFHQLDPPIAYGHEKSSATYPLQRWPTILQFLHTLLWTSITTFPFLVTVVFWALLVDPSTLGTRYDAWKNISMHALNSAFGLFEIFATPVGPQPWLHTLFLILILGGYLGVAYITHAAQGFYPYDFLDPQKQGKLLSAYVIGIPLATVIIFSIVWLICQAKMYLLVRSECGDRTGMQVMRIKV